jgi:flagellar hook-basal body complex protein FliE
VQACAPAGDLCHQGRRHVPLQRHHFHGQHSQLRDGQRCPHLQRRRQLPQYGWGLRTNLQSIGGTSGAQQSESSFSNILSEAIGNIAEAKAQAQAANDALLTGDSGDIHTALIAAQKAEVAVSYAVEIRNRVIEAYNNIMEMQV